MTKRLYRMSSVTYGQIIRKKQILIQQNKNVIGMPLQTKNLSIHDIEDGILNCPECRKAINVGDMIFSRSSRGFSRQYHKACAERVGMI